MADHLILETTFLIDLEGERHAERAGPATAFLGEHPDAGLCLTQVTEGEVASGLGVKDRARWLDLVGRFNVLAVDLDVCWTYGQISRHLRENGLLIGTNDLWIAATAIRHDLPLVTRNEKHFRRVAGVEVVGY